MTFISKRFWDWIDTRYIVRRSLLLTTAILCGHAYFWALEFATSTERTGVDIGLIVVAVTGPVTILMGQIAKLYNDGRGS